MFSQSLALAVVTGTSVASWRAGLVAPSQRKSAVLPLRRPLIQMPASILVAAEGPGRARLCVPLLWQCQGHACELKPLELVHGCPLQDLHTDSR